MTDWTGGRGGGVIHRVRSRVRRGGGHNDGGGIGAAVLPAGLFFRSRLAANTAYAIAYLWAFVFQTLYLTLDSINRSTDPAFRPEEFPIAYGAVTLSIFGVGFGLVALGHTYRARREQPAEWPGIPSG
ncbi:hypothetical protein DDE18_10850 [Nocardioides gansuensis]|uniref:Uncharacterized protein n=1 Tax=Nocardioides gansuensis TaxID=2138300 RepID=A0A2T8FAX6_9ACTN|nr:hypothetical protein [Nocardioides gansuensis]PVG82847.1 hypothetical protein DDE18_10850 [Nocardioides gansuensis]